MAFWREKGKFAEIGDVKRARTVNSLLMAFSVLCRNSVGLAGALRLRLDCEVLRPGGLQALGELEDSEEELPRSSPSAQSLKPPALKTTSCWLG